MRWESTDGYNKYYIADSAALDDDDLKRELRQMVDEVYRATQRDVTFTIDPLHREIKAPDPEDNTHTLRVSLFSTWENKGMTEHEAVEHVTELLKAALATEGRSAEIKSGWTR